MDYTTSGTPSSVMSFACSAASITGAMATPATLNLTEFVAPFLPFVGIAIFAVVIVLAWRARAARIEDYRTGKTP